MTLYLDANMLVALLTVDALTAQARSLLQANTKPLVVSDFAATEFASVIGRQVRTGERSREEARAAFTYFDAWTSRATQRVETISGDMVTAQGFLRRLDLTLRAPDALNIAIAQRLAATLATFDTTMAKVAQQLGVAVASTQ